MCRPDVALLAPQPAPECGFGRSSLKTPGPDRWVCLKLEYERKYNQNAARACLRSNKTRSRVRSITTVQRNADCGMQQGFGIREVIFLPHWINFLPHWINIIHR
jgi:hypothetical protein